MSEEPLYNGVLEGSHEPVVVGNLKRRGIFNLTIRGTAILKSGGPATYKG